MATYYVDYEGGNDANAGTSFATRWKTLTNGATAARIAPGDTIRIMASPDPTSIGSATWTGGGRPNGQTVTGATNASPIVITTSVNHGFVTGDYVVVSGVATNTNANGVWKVGTTTGTTFQILQMDGTNTTGNGSAPVGGSAAKANNLVVKLASPVTKNIALCGGLGQKPAWTASVNVSTAQQATAFKEGGASTQINVAAAFVTGKAAYYTLPATLDLSTYQQVTFWVYQTLGTLGAAGSVYIALCSDTTGDTVVHTCNIPTLGALNSWVPVTVNLGTNLSSTVNSVAFYVATDNGAQTFYIDNIVACKAASSSDSLSLTSLISKSDGTGTEAWYPIQSINYDVVMLANSNPVVATNVALRGYNGTSETVTTYKRETVKTDAAVASASTQIVTDSGTAGNPITISGGWNRTDMSTQTGWTWFDGQNGRGYALVISSKSYINTERLAYCRYEIGLNASGIGSSNIGSCYATACSPSGVTGGIYLAAPTNCIFGDIWVNNNINGLYTSSLAACVFGNVYTYNNYNSGVFVNGDNTSITSINSGNNGTNTTAASNHNVNITAAVSMSIGSLSATNSAQSNALVIGSAVDLFINGGSTSGNLNAVVFSAVANPVRVVFNNFTIDQATEFTSFTGRQIVYSNRHDDTDGNNWQWQWSGTVNQQTSVVDSPATTAWKLSPTLSGNAAQNPVTLLLGTVVCAASSLVTVTARMRRDNTGLTMRLLCPGGQIVGVSSDVYSDMTAAANTWETVTITFTPTKPGGVQIWAEAFGGTTYSGYVCNLTASQA